MYKSARWSFTQPIETLSELVPFETFNCTNVWWKSVSVFWKVRAASPVSMWCVLSRLQYVVSSLRLSNQLNKKKLYIWIASAHETQFSCPFFLKNPANVRYASSISKVFWKASWMSSCSESILAKWLIEQAQLAPVTLPRPWCEDIIQVTHQPSWRSIQLSHEKKKTALLSMILIG